jgi:hypothetical protein
VRFDKVTIPEAAEAQNKKEEESPHPKAKF